MTINWETIYHPPKIKEFTIIKGDPDEVSTKVNALLSQGYTLHGMMMDYPLTETKKKLFVQAMVKYDV